MVHTICEQHKSLSGRRFRLNVPRPLGCSTYELASYYKVKEPVHKCHALPKIVAIN